jgi:hypothetical protein
MRRSSGSIGDFHQRLIALSQAAKLVVLYPPADARLIARSTGSLPGPFDEELLSLYRLSNGASVLDYCIAGCKNRRLADIAEHTLGLWAANDLLALDFVGFMTTSAGQEFGYLHDTASGGTHVVGVLPELGAGGLLPIASSIGRFFENFIGNLEATIAAHPSALYITEPPAWPLNLVDWLQTDPALCTRYRRGEFDNYWRGDAALKEIVDEALEGM